MSYRKIDCSNYTEIMEQYNVGSLLAKVITTFNYTKQDIASFFNPIEEYQLDSPVLKQVSEFLLQIAKENRKVFVFGDYDCDGITATAIMLRILKKLGINAGYYLPSRISEGYGLNTNRLAQAKEKGYDVLITVDNGVTAYQEINWAKENGVKILVTDHHIFEEKPECDSFLHPSLLDEPYHYLCGASLVYILAKYMNLDDDAMAIMAMVSTLSDVMYLKGINIKLVKDGFNLVNKHRYRNIEMLDMFEYPVDENEISFKVVPKINAVGRMSEKEISDVNKVVNFFNSDDLYEINYLKDNVIVAYNNERKQVSDGQYNLLKPAIDENAKYNFLYHDDLHVGILGLLASRIQNETNKVTVVLTKKDDKIVGSIRSIDSIDIIDILKDFADQTLNMGGHAGAAGITIPADKLDILKQYLDNKFKDLPDETIIDVLKVDKDDLTIANIQQLYNYRPYGQGRKLPKLMFDLPNIDCRTLKTDTQLKWYCNGIEFLSFRNKGLSFYKDKKSITVIGILKENRFRNKLVYQVLIQDIID